MNIIKCKKWSGLFVTAALNLLVILIFTASIVACVEDEVGDKYYTFSDEMMGQYFENKPELFSEFSKLLDTTGVMSLLNTYGEYTCFAPGNEAMLDYYQKHGRSSINEFPYDSLVKLANDHIIKDFEFVTADFVNG